MTNKDKENILWLTEAVKSVDQEMMDQAFKHQQNLTKPMGSLGQLEATAIQFAGWQSKLRPAVHSVCVRIFAADHGVCAQSVSAFPQVVTAQMIANFAAGGAAISVLSRLWGADFAVVNLGTVSPVETAGITEARIIDATIAPGTRDFSVEAAMSHEELSRALLVGKQAIDPQACDLFIGGEMGIGNTTSASAIYSALLNLTPEQSVGPGTGVGSDGLNNKQRVVAQALRLHANVTHNPVELLAALGGFEIVALVGSYIRCAQLGIPILVDGFITTAAALVAERINPGVREWFLFSHRSSEPAHGEALESFNTSPLLELGLCLGEGSGAAIAIPLIHSALALHAEMATFDQAGVSD